MRQILKRYKLFANYHWHLKNINYHIFGSTCGSINCNVHRLIEILQAVHFCVVSSWHFISNARFDVQIDLKRMPFLKNIVSCFNLSIYNQHP